MASWKVTFKNDLNALGSNCDKGILSEFPQWSLKWAQNMSDLAIRNSRWALISSSDEPTRKVTSHKCWSCNILEKHSAAVLGMRPVGPPWLLLSWLEQRRFLLLILSWLGYYGKSECANHVVLDAVFPVLIKNCRSKHSWLFNNSLNLIITRVWTNLPTIVIHHHGKVFCRIFREW